MAHDDLFVVMCKVIAYLYDCMRNDREPDVRMLAHDGDMLRIRRGYWLKIMGLLEEGGYVEGVHVIKSDQGPVSVVLDDPAVTVRGIEFMHENSTMQRAKAYLKGVSDALTPALASAVNALL